MSVAKLRVILLVNFVALCFGSSYGANILACLMSASRSHHIMDETILVALANRGHNITVLSTFSASANLPKTYHHIYTQVDDFNEWSAMRKVMLNNDTKDAETQMKRVPKTIQMIIQRSSDVIKHEAVQNLLKSDQKFDLFILDYTINDMLLGLAGHYRVPSVILSTIPAMKMLRDLIGNPSAISSTPLFNWPERKTHLTYRERINLFIEYFFEFLYVEYTNHFIFQQFYDEHFGGIDNFPTFDEVKRNVSLILTTTHFSEGAIRPALPNLIEIGGVQVKNPPNPLPENLQKILSTTDEHGVIVFSLGGNLQSADMTDEKVRIFYSVFSKLKQTVIWKWESDEIAPGKPDNVHMLKWLPQSDLLAQPNVRLFMSHCGIGGIYEAKFHGVPILGIPIYGDQLANAVLIKRQGWANVLDFDNMTETKLSDSINEMLNNASYKMTVEKLSKLFRDRPMHPLDTAIYWIEYVLRYDGAKHMQSPAAHQNYIQRNSLDIIIPAITALAIVSFIACKIVAKILSIMLKYRPLLIIAISVIAYFISPFISFGKSE